VLIYPSIMTDFFVLHPVSLAVLISIFDTDISLRVKTVIILVSHKYTFEFVIM
jgi:hypothetical protein